MSDKEETVVLPNGTRKTFPAGTSDEYIDNWMERAHNRITSQNRNWADRDPMDFARVMAGRGSMVGDVIDFLKETVPTNPLTEKPLVPDVFGRAALGRNPVIGTGDLATGAANIMAGHLDTRTGAPAPSLQDAPPDPNAIPETPTGTVPEAPITGPLPRLTPPSAAIGELIGIKPQTGETDYPERLLEAGLTVARNPAAGLRMPGGTVVAPHATPGSASGVADAAIPYAQRADRPGDLIDRIMERVAPGTDRMAATRAAGAVGRGASAVGSVAGGDIGERAGGELGALLGSLAGGVAPNVTSALLSRPVQAHYARPGDESARALQVQEELGITPTPGATGNARMSMVENTAARVPIPFNPAAQRQELTARQFENAGMEALNRIYDQGPGIQTPDVTGTQMRMGARQGLDNLADYWRRGYAIVDEGVPPEMRVWPGQTRQAVTDIRTPGSGESAATRDLVQNAYDDNVARSIVAGDPAPGAPQGPVAGIPYADTRPSGTDLFHSQDSANPSAGGAVNIMRRAFAGDTADALVNDPWMVQAFPNPADRVAKAERLRVLASEYAREKSSGQDTRLPPTTRPGQGGDTGLDITQQDPGSVPPGTASFPTGGGSYDVLNQIRDMQTGPSAFTVGREPDRMAVLQRNAQSQYPPIARNVVGNQWQGPSGEVEPMAVARSWGQGKKGIGEFAKDILSNNDPGMVARGNLLAEGGELFRERVRADTGSKTMPLMTTAAVLPAMVTAPGTVFPAGIAAYASALGVSSDTLARYLARTRPQMFELMARKGADSALMAAGQMADDQARAEREGTGFIEEGARAFDEAQQAYRRELPFVGVPPVIPRTFDAMRGR